MIFPSSKGIVPGWVHGAADKMINKLDGHHAEVSVVSAALLGPDGFSCESAEESINFKATDYGPVMLEGYAMIAGQCLSKILEAQLPILINTVASEGNGPGTELYADELEKLIQATIRKFVKRVMTYTGSKFCEQAKQFDDTKVAALVSAKVLRVWVLMTERTVTIHAEGCNDEEGQPGAD